MFHPYTTRRMSVRALIVVFALSLASASSQVLQTPLAGSSIPRFVEPVPTFVGNRADGTHPLRVTAMEFQQKILPSSFYAALPAPYNQGTYVWGYKVEDLATSTTYGPHVPAYTVEAQRHTPTSITYVNALVNPVLQQYLTVDQTIHWAAPYGLSMMNMAAYSGPIPTVVHLHGGEVPSAIDGHPDAWFTANVAGSPQFTGAAYNGTVNGMPVGTTYVYPNTQEAATLWFHDHALGITRLTVYSGLEAFYLLRGDKDTGPGNDLNLPAGPYEIELAIQDRQFDMNGQQYFPADGINPTIHPFWIPEFFGDVITVNGKSWPYLTVEPRRYRFRLLNVSNARFYSLSFGENGPDIYQIGTDGGLMDKPVRIRYPNRLVLAPSERADVIIDFSDYEERRLVLKNNANAPFPGGDPVDPATTGKVMQFRVNEERNEEDEEDETFDPSRRGARLRETPFEKLVDYEDGEAEVVPDVVRRLTLNEVEGAGGPLNVFVNNSKWNGTLSPNAGGVTELPAQGSTELWEIINITEDAHPIHIHLVQFQLMNRQRLDEEKYEAAYEAAFTGGVSPVDGQVYPPGTFIPGYGPPMPYQSTAMQGYLGGNPDPTPFLEGDARPADRTERGWKDTYKMFPGEVTRILVRWAPIDIPVGQTTSGTNYYAFDPTEGPGYVWHCHILDHEDNEMMRPYRVTAPGSKAIAYDASSAAAKGFLLEQNHPNPFNPTTQIRFSIPENAHVQLTLYSTLGEKIRTLIDNNAPAGDHTVVLHAEGLPNGVYYYRIQAGNFSATRSMLLTR